MRNSSEDAPRQYVVVDSDPYDRDRDATYLYLNRTLGPDYASQWLDRLEVTINNLTGFPGPLSHARDEEASALYGREVRRLLYYGPTRRRSGTPVRILFTLLPPDPEDPPDVAETAIFLLRLLHGGQALAADAPDEG